MAPTTKTLCFLLLFCCAGAAFAIRLQRLSVEEHHGRFRKRAAARPLDNTQSGMVFNPIHHGADPTGVRDSSAAFEKTLTAAFASQLANSRELLPGITDLGGVVIDLQGGRYNISKPIRFPPTGGGNLVMQGGTLLAGDDFPGDRYLVELWSTSPPSGSDSTPAVHVHITPPVDIMSRQSNGEDVYYEAITFRDILFDSAYRGGGLRLVASVRTRIDNCFFIHFATTGILAEGGHETYISSTFLGQHLTIGADPGEKDFTGTAIDLAGNDNAVTDVAIFSAAVGVMLRGQANILTQVHCYNKATGFGGVGVYVKLPGLSQTRIVDCYMDYTGIVLEDPVQVVIANGFFLGDAGILLKSVKGDIQGLTIVDNSFAGSGWKEAIVKLDGEFKNVEQVVVERNQVREMNVKVTSGRLTAAGKGKNWTVDFGPMLLFPDRIKHLQYSLFVRGRGNESTAALPTHAVTGVVDNKVVVEASEEVDGVVSVEVDQNLIPGENNVF